MKPATLSPIFRTPVGTVAPISTTVPTKSDPIIAPEGLNLWIFVGNGVGQTCEHVSKHVLVKRCENASKYLKRSTSQMSNRTGGRQMKEGHRPAGRCPSRWVGSERAVGLSKPPERRRCRVAQFSVVGAMHAWSRALSPGCGIAPTARRRRSTPPPTRRWEAVQASAVHPTLGSVHSARNAEQWISFQRWLRLRTVLSKR